jgi:hypothetical protein
MGMYCLGAHFNLTKPDGTTDKIGTLDSEAEGSIWFLYVVDKIGNWTVRFTWEGDTYNTPVDVVQPLTVQQEQIPPWPAASLPTEPWTYPINPENREWMSISGPWYHAWRDAARTSFNLYSTAPRSSHILYRLPPISGLGGIIGGEYSTGSYYDVNAIPFCSGTRGAIMGGKGYWTGDGNIHCFDAHTGEELWQVPGSFDFSAIENGQPELVSTSTQNLIKYDGFTGKVLVNITGIIGSKFRNFDTSTASVFGGYVLDTQKVGSNYYLVKWSFLGSDTNFTNRIALDCAVAFRGCRPNQC